MHRFACAQAVESKEKYEENKFKRFACAQAVESYSYF